MSAEIDGDGAKVEVGNPCPANGKATVSVVFLMTDQERTEMVDRIVDGRLELGREEVIEGIGLAEPEGA